MDNETVIDIVVIPKSSRNVITIDENGTIRIYLNSPPVDGKANQECIQLLSKKLKISRSSIRIDKGARSRKKRLIINGMKMETLMERIK